MTNAPKPARAGDVDPTPAANAVMEVRHITTLTPVYTDIEDGDMDYHLVIAGFNTREHAERFRREISIPTPSKREADATAKLLEEIARIIDPEAWDTEKYRNSPAAPATIALADRRQRARAKVDDILSLQATGGEHG